MEADELAALLREWADDNAAATNSAYDENTFFICEGEDKFVVIVAKVTE